MYEIEKVDGLENTYLIGDLDYGYYVFRITFLDVVSEDYGQCGLDEGHMKNM